MPRFEMSFVLAYLHLIYCFNMLVLFIFYTLFFLFYIFSAILICVYHFCMLFIFSVLYFKYVE